MQKPFPLRSLGKIESVQVLGFGCRAMLCLGFSVLAFGVEGLGFRISGVVGLFRIWGVGFRVWGLGSECLGG